MTRNLKETTFTTDYNHRKHDYRLDRAVLRRCKRNDGVVSREATSLKSIQNGSDYSNERKRERERQGHVTSNPTKDDMKYCLNMLNWCKLLTLAKHVEVSIYTGLLRPKLFPGKIMIISIKTELRKVSGLF